MTLKFRFPIDVYCCYMTFIVSDQIEKEFDKVCKKHKDTESKWDDWDGAYNNYGPEHYILIDLKSLTHNTIAHEVFHATSRICENRAIEDEETKCWLAGFITQEIYKNLDKKKQPINHV